MQDLNRVKKYGKHINFTYVWNFQDWFEVSVKCKGKSFFNEGSLYKFKACCGLYGLLNKDKKNGRVYFKVQGSVSVNKG